MPYKVCGKYVHFIIWKHAEQVSFIKLAEGKWLKLWSQSNLSSQENTSYPSHCVLLEVYKNSDAKKLLMWGSPLVHILIINSLINRWVWILQIFA